MRASGMAVGCRCSLVALEFAADFEESGDFADLVEDSWAVGVLAVGGPAVDTLAVGSPAVGIPAVGSPAVGSPAVGSVDDDDSVAVDSKLAASDYTAVWAGSIADTAASAAGIVASADNIVETGVDTAASVVDIADNIAVMAADTVHTERIADKRFGVVRNCRIRRPSSCPAPRSPVSVVALREEPSTAN